MAIAKFISHVMFRKNHKDPNVDYKNWDGRIWAKLLTVKLSKSDNTKVQLQLL